MKRKDYLALATIALIGTLTFSLVAVAAIPHGPKMSVDLTTRNISASDPNAGFDSIIYVSVPHQSPFAPPLYDLNQVFIVQQIDVTESGPGIPTSTSTLVTCTNAASPAYPSRFMPTTCTGIFAYRVNSQVYPGSDTGIYWVGWNGLNVAGTYSFTYTVTGLFNGASVTLSQSFSVNVH